MPMHTMPDDHRRDMFCFILFFELSSYGRIDPLVLHDAARFYVEKLSEHGIADLGFYFNEINGMSGQVRQAIFRAMDFGIIDMPMGYTSRMTLSSYSPTARAFLREQTDLTQGEVETAKECGRATLNALLEGVISTVT